jgi:D-3-phosphoglycerate dehydrogenase / 2-oxoglutarate reductase
MSRFTVLVTDFAWPSLDIEREILSAVGAELLIADSGADEELTELAPRAHAILTNWRTVPEEALEAASDCLVVSRFGIGVDNIPVDRATELGIIVTNVPGFCTDEVSDHAMALLLACARRVVRLAASTRERAWNIEIAHGIHRLRGQTLGMVGFGAIARSLIPKATGFGLKVVAYTPRLDLASLPSGVSAAATLEELLAVSDFVSLHAPSTPETKSLIGEAELRAMKPTAYLINTSRGALVDEDALARAIRENWIAGAALDVLSLEPPRANHPLLGFESVLVTPHAAFYSQEAIVELETRAATNVAEVLSGRVPAAVVNPAVLNRPDLRLRPNRAGG